MGLPDWRRLDYLRSGTPRQQAAYTALVRLGLFETLRKYSPLLAGTIPLDIDLPGSDLDIICEAHDLDAFAADVRATYGHHDSFALRARDKDGLSAVVASFTGEGFAIEIFAQPLPVTSQNAYRHMMVEARLLALGGPDFRDAVRRLKAQGMKTEPAFAHLLRFSGDPYTKLLDLYHADESALKLLLKQEFAP